MAIVGRKNNHDLFENSFFHKKDTPIPFGISKAEKAPSSPEDGIKSTPTYSPITYTARVVGSDVDGGAAD